MLDYYILDNKPEIELNGETGIDLLHKTIDLSKSYSGEFLMVNEYYVARPDLISLAIYRDDKYADIICKLNGISNPFELNEGMIIFIPTIESIINILNTKGKNTKTETITDKDDSISSSNIEGDQKKRTAKRSPAQQTEGDSNYVIDRNLGMIFY